LKKNQNTEKYSLDVTDTPIALMLYGMSLQVILAPNAANYWLKNQPKTAFLRHAQTELALIESKLSSRQAGKMNN
jgi:hypothetical protein